MLSVAEAAELHSLRGEVARLNRENEDLRDMRRILGALGEQLKDPEAQKRWQETMRIAQHEEYVQLLRLRHIVEILIEDYADCSPLWEEAKALLER